MHHIRESHQGVVQLFFAKGGATDLLRREVPLSGVVLGTKKGFNFCGGGGGE